MRRAEHNLIGKGWEMARHRYRAFRAVWTRSSRYYSLLAFGVALSLALTACGGGGGGGGGGSNRRILNGANDIRNFSDQDPRAGSLVNNVGQAQNILRDYTARPINPGSRRTITPQESVLNMSNALTDPDVINEIKQNYPNWSEFLDESGNNVTIDFDKTPGSLDQWLSGVLDSGENRVISRQQLPKLFRGKMTASRTDTSGNTKQIEVTCPEEKPLEIKPESQSDPKVPNLKLVGSLKAKLPRNVQPGGQEQEVQIDLDGLKIEDTKTAGGGRPGDTIVLGAPQKQEQNGIKLSRDQNDDAIPSFNISAMKWESTELTWIDDDLLQYFSESVQEAYLSWSVNSGYFFIYEEEIGCAGYYGNDWSLQPLPRSRRQAELLLPFTFDWDDTFDGCGAVDDYQLIFTYAEVTYIVQSLEESEYIDWCEETDSELDAYLAALLDLPPGADLADTVLTAEAWATGLPQFMYFLYQLHNSLASPPPSVSITGEYPSSYAATFTNFEYAGSQLNGKISFEFSSSADDVQLTAVFESGFTWSDVALTGTLKMTLNESTGQMTIEISSFSWDIPDVSRGSVPNGTLSSTITLTNNELTQVRTSALNMTLNVRNLLITPPQTYNVTLSVVEALEWPVKECNFSTTGILNIQGQVVGQSVEMRVDFGADGECGKAVITSGGLSATYNLETGLFESLSRLRSKTRALPQPRSLRFWHKPTPKS